MRTTSALVLLLTTTTTPTIARHNLTHHNPSHNFFFDAVASRVKRINSTASDTHYVAIRPDKINNAGWGNLLYHIVEVIGLALSTGRRPVLTNAAFSALFDHPLAPAHAWTHLNNSKILDLYRQVSGTHYAVLRPCGDVAKHPLSQWHDHMYTDSCLGNTLMHPQVKADPPPPPHTHTHTALPRCEP